MNENIIEVRNLSKKFTNHQAVKNISFDLKRGEIKGILGANGAGKTTTITMLLGLLTPTSGSIKILSHDISKNRYKILNKINFSSPYVDLPKKLTVRQNLFVYGMLYGVANINKKIKSIDEIILNEEDIAETKAETALKPIALSSAIALGVKPSPHGLSRGKIAESINTTWRPARAA